MNHMKSEGVGEKCRSSGEKKGPFLVHAGLMCKQFGPHTQLWLVLLRDLELLVRFTMDQNRDLGMSYKYNVNIASKNFIQIGTLFLTRISFRPL